MHKKIYFQHKPLFITDELTEEIKQQTTSPDSLLLDDFTTKKVAAVIDKMNRSETGSIVILHNNVQNAFDVVKKHFKFIQAAGGLVHTDNDEFLLIFRRSKWDLPKGKLDEDETMESCALREIEEETGLKNPKLEEPLIVTHHTYYQDKTYILKESHWFLMHGEHQELTPQTDEDIEKCEWVNTKNLAVYLENTHPSIADVIEDGLKKLNKKKEV